MELSTGYNIETDIDSTVYITSTCDKSPGLSYTALFYGQPGIINNITNGTKFAIGFSPYNHSSIVLGGITVIPDDNETLSDDNALMEGETAVSETANYNYTFQAKLDRLQALFTNKQGTIKTQMLNGEAIVQILRDILDEFNSNLKSYINSQIANTFNSHTHTGVQTGLGTSGKSATQISNYAPASNISGKDNDYLSNAKCYVNDNGDVL